jgi:hypothetical protein
MMLGLAAKCGNSAALMRYLNSRIQSCYCAPMIWVFAPKNRETEVAARSDAALIKGLIRGILRKVSATSAGLAATIA